LFWDEFRVLLFPALLAWVFTCAMLMAAAALFWLLLPPVNWGPWAAAFEWCDWLACEFSRLPPGKNPLPLVYWWLFWIWIAIGTPLSFEAPLGPPFDDDLPCC